MGLQRKQQRETHGHDIDFSSSSINTSYNNEYSVSVSETNEYHLNKYNVSPLKLKPMSSISNKSDSQQSRTGSHLDKILEAKEHHKNERIDNKWNRRQTNHLKGPMNVDPRFANNEKDLSASNQSAESFKIPLISDQSPNGSINDSQNTMPPIEIDADSKEIIPFKTTSTITPEPSVDAMSIIMSSDDGSAIEDSKSKNERRWNGHGHKKHRHRDRKKHHKSKRDQIKELKNELIALQETVNIKDSRIKDLEQINKEIRRTLLLRDNKIQSLQNEMDALRMKLSKNKSRATSAIFRPPRSRIKRASSFTIDSLGNISRTALLPSQFDHNNKLIKSSMINAPKMLSLNTPKVPSTGLRRSHSSGINGYHRKAQSQKYFEIK